MVRAYEDLPGVEVLTHCIMNNHFHLLVRVPQRPADFDLSLEVVVARLERALGKDAMGLLRFAAHLSQSGHSFPRLLALVRAALWERLDTLAVLRSCGTAGGSFKLLGAAQSAWLPGFQPTLT